MARENLFNILAGRFDFENLNVLDLFSGTGCISYEFASRGANLVHSVEVNARHARFIRETVSRLELKQIKPVQADVLTFLKNCSISYNIIFADPPYNLRWLKEIPDRILNSGVLSDNGTFILEHPRDYNFNNHPNFSEHRNYGSVNFSFFQL